MTLRTQLNLLFGVTLLMGMLLVTLGTLELTRNEMDKLIAENLDEALEEISRSAEQTMPTRRWDLLVDGAIATASVYPYVAGLRLELRTAGESAAKQEMWFLPGGRRRGKAPRDMESGRYVGREQLVAVAPGTSVLITLFSDRYLGRSFQRRLLASFGSLGIFAVVVGLIVADRMTSRLVTAPLEEMRRLTRKITEGDLTASLPDTLAVRQDEIGALGTSFSRMMDALRRSRSENDALIANVRNFNRQLEARVAEATAQLGRKNQQLQAVNRALIEARDQITRQERLAALGQLLGSIAHEIGTPLSTISGHLQLLLVDNTLPREAREALGVALQEAVRMRDIIRRFLSRARGTPPAREVVAVPELLSQVVELSLPLGQRDRYEVEAHVAPEVVEPFTDPALLRQLLINLVSNARDAMPDGGHLDLGSSRDGRFLVIHVDDSGPGIPPEEREHIFEPFFTTKAVGEGTGLGLAICREITRALHGSISVTGAPLGGARFTLRIPAWDDEPAARSEV